MTTTLRSFALSRAGAERALPRRVRAAAGSNSAGASCRALSSKEARYALPRGFLYLSICYCCHAFIIFLLFIIMTICTFVNRYD